MGINVNNIIGIYLATTTDDDAKLSDVVDKINDKCKIIKEETEFVIDTIIPSNVAAFAYSYSCYVKLKNSQDGYVRAIITGDAEKRKEMTEYFRSKLPEKLHKYFINSEPLLVKKKD